MYTVYVLKSLINGRFYIGQTNNIERRLKEHNNGKSKYTKSTRPFVLIYSEDYPTRQIAVKREHELKSGKGREWLKAQMARAVA